MPCYAGSISYISCLPWNLIESYSLVLDLILCHFINLVQPKCTVFIKSPVVYNKPWAFAFPHHSLTQSNLCS